MEQQKVIGEKNMRVLVLTISTGQGHHATGQAIESTFQEMGVQCDTLDAYEYIEPLLSELVSKGYLLSTAYVPKLASKFYNIVVKKNKPVDDFSMTKLANKFLAKELKEYIEEYGADVVICTHVLSATMVNIMVEKGWIQALTVGIVTDFTIHPLWEECSKLDYYVTSSELLEYQMEKKGLDTKKMLPLGIPIKEKFSKRISKEEARKQLGLKVDRPTLLLMSGSMGYGKIDGTIEKLDRLNLDFQTMVVCGNNKKMYQKIKNLSVRKPFFVYGYVDNVDLMMDAASCIITKPGGITSSEALAKELPMIMVNPIPGHEVRNAEFMVNNGIAVYATKTFPVDEAVFSLLKHPDRIENLRATIALYAKKDSSKNLCEFLIQRVNG